MIRNSLKMAVLAAVCAVLVACAGPTVKYQGAEVDDTEVKVLAQAAHIAEVTWVHVFEAAEQRYMTGQLSDADWQVYVDIAEGMVHNLDRVPDRLEAYLLTPEDLGGARQARRVEARQAVVALQATVQKALTHAAQTLGGAYK